MTAGWGPPRFIRVYGAWIALVTALVIAAAAGASTLAPREYESWAIVVVEARVRANTTPVAPDMGTEKELAQSGLVVGPAARKLGTTEDDLLDGLAVSVAPDANVLTLTYRDGNAIEAQRRAAALSDAYVLFRNSGEAAEGAARGAAAATTATQHATLVTSAVVPGAPIAHPVLIYLAVGLVVGLLCGVGTALLRDRTSDRIRGRDDFARVSGAAVLATVPRLRRRNDDPRTVLLRQPQSPAAESFRYLRSRLQPLLRGTAVVLVTSAGDGEGRTTTAANLAVAIAQSGHDVVLIDGDLRSPRLHEVFGRNSTVGLSGVLGGRHGVDEALVATEVPHLTLMPAGPLPANAGDLLDGHRLRWILDVVRARADVVIVDSAAVLSVSDSITLASAADHVLLVGDYRQTTRGYVTRMLAELTGVVQGGLSAVLLNVPAGAGGLNPQGRPHNGAAVAEVPTVGAPGRVTPANLWEPSTSPPTFEPRLRDPMPALYRTMSRD
jgi:capsular exopolysaccharide synthesis family protein